LFGIKTPDLGEVFPGSFNLIDLAIGRHLLGKIGEYQFHWKMIRGQANQEKILWLFSFTLKWW